MSKHTPEPWSEARQKAARVASCANACAGMEDPAAEIAKLRQDRDGLLEALKVMMVVYDGPLWCSLRSGQARHRPGGGGSPMSKHAPEPWEVGPPITSEYPSHHTVYRLIYGAGRKVASITAYGKKVDGSVAGKKLPARGRQRTVTEAELHLITRTERLGTLSEERNLEEQMDQIRETEGLECARQLLHDTTRYGDGPEGLRSNLMVLAQMVLVASTAEYDSDEMEDLGMRAEMLFSEKKIHRAAYDGICRFLATAI